MSETLSYPFAVKNYWPLRSCKFCYLATHLRHLLLQIKNNNDVLSKLSKCKNNLSKHNNKLKNDLEHKLRFPNFYDLNSWSYKLCINFLHARTLQHHLQTKTRGTLQSIMIDNKAPLQKILFKLY